MATLGQLWAGRRVKTQFSVLVIGDTSILDANIGDKAQGKPRLKLETSTTSPHRRVPGSMIKAVLSSLRPTTTGEGGSEFLASFVKEVMPAPRISTIGSKSYSKEKALSK